jgi:flagellar basal-body rod protein FlgF
VNNGIYTAYSGMKAQMEALDLLANNLANINTTGFKEQKAFYTLLNDSQSGTQAPLESAVQSHAVLAEAAFNLANGSLLETGRELDVALAGPGFLTVQTPAGLRYTRNGNLQTNASSQLVTVEGFPVLGERGAITLGPGKVEISEQGEVVVDGRQVDRLKMATFDNSVRLMREGDTLLAAPQGAPESRPADATAVKQGFLEQSNVNPVLSTVRMVEIMRHFEAIQKCMSMISNVVDAKSIEKLSR